MRQGPDSTDLVLRTGPTGPAWNALASAGPALFTPLVLGVPTLLVAFWMALAGARASTVFVVVGVIAGLEDRLYDIAAGCGGTDVEFTPAP
ncbi:hypothetical protein [Streptomyces subrutilus]|uniref:hypothetical protein n=1 Tax=Streptomyces subrutilus TaxID=36818 RepID=UPI0033DA0B4E